MAATADLNEIGVGVVEDGVVTDLSNRLRIEDWRKTHPAVAEEQIVRPIIIVGQPRTGTSILHDLMAQDPANRAPLSWEIERPGAGATDRDLRDRPSHRRGPGRLRPGRVDHPRLHRVPRARRTARSGGRAHLHERLPLDAVPVAVRSTDVQPLAAARGRHGAGLPMAPAFPAAPAVRAQGRALAAQVARPPLVASRVDRGVSRRDRDPEPPRSAQGDRVDQRCSAQACAR